MTVNKSRVAMIMALAVFSHWILDFVTHIPDLSLWGGEMKVGLGLWQSAKWSFIVESLLFAATLIYYLSATRTTTFRQSWGLVILCAILFGLFALSFAGGPPPTVAVTMIVGLVTNLIAALAAGWLAREPLPSVR